MTAPAIAEAGLPILIPDTCALLDIIQAPVRDTFRVEDAMAIRRVLHALDGTPPRLVAVVPELVPAEFADNVARAEREVTEGLARLDSEAQAAARRMGWLDGAAPDPMPALGERGHPAFGRTLANQALTRAVLVRHSVDDRDRASLRVLLNTAPSRRGSQSYKDCLIVETSLAFVREYRACGGAAAVAFLSSNTKDYMEGRSVRAPLNDNFDDLGITFVSRWSALLGWLPRGT
ncbi:hypothetical protein [Falsiroseomonas ponticola]|uniref:hypothetical protein n=1 Tax=Falsiroseomonas ponticola TaxID=2786951 RepID=UPI0019331BDE|nr:hypothetical protein [Roseomonas ponticola]